ncbi:cytochrome c [Aquiflexum sp. LQ15W]|uniref:c-type cytochrome n=1 Tax=Cognataquiflexum nitidum TaxID=2922272 RepID=UPI001F140EFD|nr:cytochrome c [Cognataquiflexum nitidum]MCH6198757.1 cytochrome c [Cognataquiflexum nitidum]
MNKLIFAFAIVIIGLNSCKPKSSNPENTLASISDTKVLQYAIEGKALYEANCANCHQKNGTGLGKLIPPIFQSDYFLEDVPRTAKIIKHGQKGEIIVNGVAYNQEMPANSKLTNIEIAHIMTYLYNIWGNEMGVIDATMVEDYLKN